MLNQFLTSKTFPLFANKPRKKLEIRKIGEKQSTRLSLLQKSVRKLIHTNANAVRRDTNANVVRRDTNANVVRRKSSSKSAVDLIAANMRQCGNQDKAIVFRQPNQVQRYKLHCVGDKRSVSLSFPIRLFHIFHTDWSWENSARGKRPVLSMLREKRPHHRFSQAPSHRCDRLCFKGMTWRLFLPKTTSAFDGLRGMSRQSQKTKGKNSMRIFFSNFSSSSSNPLGHDNATSPPPPPIRFRHTFSSFFFIFKKKNSFTLIPRRRSHCRRRRRRRRHPQTPSRHRRLRRLGPRVQVRPVHTDDQRRRLPWPGQILCGFSFLPLWRCNYKEKRWTMEVQKTMEMQKMPHGDAKDAPWKWKRPWKSKRPWRCKRCPMEVQYAPWRCKRCPMEVERSPMDTRQYLRQQFFSSSFQFDATDVF